MANGDHQRPVARVGNSRLVKAELPLQLDRLAYRINDSCHVLGIGRGSLYKLAAQGKLKLISVAGRRVVTAESMQLLIRELSDIK